MFWKRTGPEYRKPPDRFVAAVSLVLTRHYVSLEAENLSTVVQLFTHKAAIRVIGQ